MLIDIHNTDQHLNATNKTRYYSTLLHKHKQGSELVTMMAGPALLSL